MNFVDAWTAIRSIYHKVLGAVHVVIADVEKIEPAAQAVVAAINPSAGAAIAVVNDILMEVDKVFEAANGAATVNFAADIVQQFKASKQAVIADLIALGVTKGTAPASPAPAKPA